MGTRSSSARVRISAKRGSIQISPLNARSVSDRDSASKRSPLSACRAAIALSCFTRRANSRWSAKGGTGADTRPRISSVSPSVLRPRAWAMIILADPRRRLARYSDANLSPHIMAFRSCPKHTWTSAIATGSVRARILLFTTTRTEPGGTMRVALLATASLVTCS